MVRLKDRTSVDIRLLVGVARYLEDLVRLYPVLNERNISISAQNCFLKVNVYDTEENFRCGTQVSDFAALYWKAISSFLEGYF